MSGEEALARARAAIPNRFSQPLPYRKILGTRVDGTSYEDASARILDWARRHERRAVYIANVHMVMEAFDQRAFRNRLNAGDLITPDGMPLVWLLRLLGVKGQARVYGPDLMLHLCAGAARDGLKVGFFGSRPETLERLRDFLVTAFPALDVIYMYAPPFRPMDESEMAAVAHDVGRSRVDLLFVGLGCPKQEIWIAENKARFNCPLVGVGAAFDFHAGVTRQAPTVLQRLGLEWAFRLIMEPRRLWRRYVYNNPRFIVLALWQLLAAK